MDVLNQKLLEELNKAMNYNQGSYIQDVIKTVLKLTNPTLNDNSRKKFSNHLLYDALVKYNKIKGL